jgi:hypothetical protein
MPLDIEEIEKRCKDAIRREPEPDASNGWDHCDPAETYHAQECETAMEHSHHDCLTKKADEARERLRRVGLRHLLTRLAQKPADANGLDTLSGMAQGSPIYPLLSVLYDLQLGIASANISQWKGQGGNACDERVMDWDFSS